MVIVFQFKYTHHKYIHKYYIEFDTLFKCHKICLHPFAFLFTAKCLFMVFQVLESIMDAKKTVYTNDLKSSVLRTPYNPIAKEEKQSVSEYSTEMKSK